MFWFDKLSRLGRGFDWNLPRKRFHIRNLFLLLLVLDIKFKIWVGEDLLNIWKMLSYRGGWLFISGWFKRLVVLLSVERIWDSRVFNPLWERTVFGRLFFDRNFVLFFTGFFVKLEEEFWLFHCQDIQRVHFLVFTLALAFATADYFSISTAFLPSLFLGRISLKLPECYFRREVSAKLDLKTSHPFTFLPDHVEEALKMLKRGFACQCETEWIEAYLFFR